MLLSSLYNKTFLHPLPPRRRPINGVANVLSFQTQILEFPWPDIQQYEVDEEGMSFNFEYTKPGRKPRWVKIFTAYVSTPVVPV